jgi:hypothetical protein
MHYLSRKKLWLQHSKNMNLCTCAINRIVIYKKYKDLETRFFHQVAIQKFNPRNLQFVKVYIKWNINHFSLCQLSIVVVVPFYQFDPHFPSIYFLANDYKVHFSKP